MSLSLAPRETSHEPRETPILSSLLLALLLLLLPVSQLGFLLPLTAAPPPLLTCKQIRSISISISLLIPLSYYYHYCYCYYHYCYYYCPARGVCFSLGPICGSMLVFIYIYIYMHVRAGEFLAPDRKRGRRRSFSRRARPTGRVLELYAIAIR